MKTAVVILHYRNNEHFFQCFNSIRIPNCDYYVVENDSSDNLKDMMIPFVGIGWVKKYALFSENIANSAIRDFFLDGHLKFEDYDYVVTTDSDLLVTPGWFDEIHTILENHPEVMQIGISLDMANLPIKSFPMSVRWVPPIIKEHEDYYETAIGNWLATFRSEDCYQYIEHLRQTGASYRDSHLHEFIYSIGRKSGRTKIHKAAHLTWNYYQELDHPYTQERLSAVTDIWAENKRCSYEVFE